jgi:hypothetical protein
VIERIHAPQRSSRQSQTNNASRNLWLEDEGHFINPDTSHREDWLCFAKNLLGSPTRGTIADPHPIGNCPLTMVAFPHWHHFTPVPSTDDL